MEGKNKKDMSVDELVKQLKLVLDIDETEEEPEKEAAEITDTEVPAAKSVGEAGGEDVGEELEKLFEEEEAQNSRRKKKRKLFGRKRKEEKEPEEEPDPIETAAEEKPADEKPKEPEKQPVETQTEQPEEQPYQSEEHSGEHDAWLADALTGIFADGEKTEENPEEAVTETPAEEGPAEEPAEEQIEESAEEPVEAAVEEAVKESAEEPIEEEPVEEEPAEEIPVAAVPVFDIPKEEESEPEEAAEEIPEEDIDPITAEETPEPEIPDGIEEEIPEEFEDDDVKKYAAAVISEEGSEEDVKTFEEDAKPYDEDHNPFVSDVFEKRDTNEDDAATKAVSFGKPEEKPEEEDNNATRKVGAAGNSADPGEIIDDELLSDIEDFDVIYSDKKGEGDGYSTADEAIMDAFAEKPKAAKKQRRTEAEELDDIFSTIPASPVGGKNAADYEEDDESLYADEFTSYDQRKTFLDEYKKKYQSLKKSLIGSSVFAALLLIYELLPLFIKNMPHAFNRTENPSVFTLVGLALFTVCAAFASKHTFAGFRSVFKGSTTLPSMAFLAVLFTYIYGIITAVKGDVTLYPMMSVSALSVVMMLAAEMRTVKRRTLAFRIISGSPVKNKYVLERYQGDDEKTQGSSALGVSRAKFISKFTASNMKRSNSYGYLNLLFPATALIFIAFFAVGLFLKKDVSYAVSYGFAAGIFCMPAAIFPALSLPAFLCSKKSYNDGSCVVSDAEAEKYTAASVVFFEDSDVFPPSHDKITSVRLYNDSRMDHIMYVMMSVFGKLGGPLLVICENAAKEYGSSTDVEILRTEDNGVEARVDSLTVLIGSAEFMGGSLDRVYKEDDGMYENNETERIMYMSVNGTVAAKFYIEYGMDPEFKKIIKQLSNATRTVAIRTLDPNIDNALLSAFIDPEMYNCRITSGRTRKNDVREESCGTVVSKSSVKSLMRTLLLCDKTVYTSKINALICFLSLIIGLLITVFLMITGSLNVINVLYVLAYQLIIAAVVRIITRLHV